MGDGALAVHARRGDGAAFAELARRYRALILATVREPRFGLSRDDQRQEALIGLYQACREYDPRRGAFRAFAKVAVRRQVLQAFQAAGAGKHRLLSQALRFEHGDLHDADAPPLAECIPGPAGDDPAVIVPLRLQLRELAARPGGQAAVRALTAPGAKRKRFTPAQIASALALVAQGRPVSEAAAAIGTSFDTVARWRDQAGIPPQRTRKRYTPEQVATALALVEEGQTLRAAGAAIGASDVAVARWRNRAA